MKGVTILKDEIHNRRYLQVELKELLKARKKGNSLLEFLEDLEDMLDAELAKDEPSESWESAKKELKKKGVLSKHV